MIKDDARQGHAGDSRQLHAAIDRIEDNDVAVLVVGEGGKTQVEIPVSLLPEGASDGDHLRITIMIDRDSRAAAESRIEKLQDQLKQQSSTNDKKDFKL